LITAYPLEFTIGPLPITGFGIAMMVAFLLAGWLVDRELQRLGFNRDFGGDMLMGAVIGGIVGAKLWYVALHGTDALLERSGLVWYGGLVGGSLGVLLMMWRRRVSFRWTAHLVAPVLAAGYAIGRVGCFVVGDDYGRPTDLPWAVAFPEGAPATTAEALRSFGVLVPDSIASDTVLAVHPTQLYEVLIMVAVFAVLWRWRTKPQGTGWLFGAYLVMAGAERFFVEIFRAKDDRLVGSLTVAQLMSLALVALGAMIWIKLAKAGPVQPGAYLATTPRGSQA
jgi:phosphatidylglycerol:prolipoprotein diacylglycerol transferase